MSELIPQVVEAAREHFGPYTNDLFSDPRVRIVAEDGRNLLLASDQQYDVIVADLFRPWGAGIGDLYTREHFAAVRARLRPGGIFAQWLPLYQMSRQEFGIIVRTLTEVFPQVTLWRGNFVPQRPIVVLIAQKELEPLDPCRLQANLQAVLEQPGGEGMLIDMLVSVKGFSELMARPENAPFLRSLLPQLVGKVPYTFYAGNLSQNRDLFAEYPVNTDERPVLEYLAPRTRGAVGAGEARWLTDWALDALFDELLAALPPDEDPYLARLSEAQRGYVLAGKSYYASFVYHQAGVARCDEQLIRQSQNLLEDYLARLELRGGPEGGSTP